MKEIIYIQAGSLANFTGTHFWNTQESYFIYGSEEDGNADDPIVSNDISFREGLTYKNEPILCPRLLVFDRKVKFGTLSQQSALQGDGSKDADDHPGSLWTGNVDEYKQAPIQKSKYHSQLEHEDDEELKPNHEEGELEIRYWSDFNRLYYTPRSIQRLPDTADWENVEGDWIEGRETFRRFDEDTGLMEDSLRLFVEECDSVQGLQLMEDTTTFGSFIDSFLTSFRDEFSKLSVLSFSFLSNCIPGHIQVDDTRGRRKALNDALFLRSMNGLGVFSVPIQSPSTWPRPLTQEGRINPHNIYHTSGLLSAQIESITLPLRLRGTQETLTSFISQSNWRGITQYAELSGRIPSGVTNGGSGTDSFDPRVFQFSAVYPLEKTAAVDFTRRDVSRGLFLPSVSAYESWSEQQGLQRPFLHTTHAPPYPLPTSFPHIFPSTYTNSRAESIPLFTSLSTTPRTSKLFRSYAKFVEANVDLGDAVGLDRDEMKELGNELWGIADGYDDGENCDDVETGVDDIGEDEES